MNLIPTALVVLLWVAIIWLWILVVADIRRRPDLSFSQKMVWICVVILANILGLILYALVSYPRHAEKKQT